MFLQRHKIKENWNPEFLSSCEAEEFNNFQSIIVKDKQDFNKRKYLAFEKTWKLLSTMDCPVFVTGGTLLGIIRDNKLIDWDDDIDITIWDNDVNKLVNNLKLIKQSLTQKTYYLTDDIIIIHKNWGCPIKIQYKSSTYPFVDIFTYHKDLA